MNDKEFLHNNIIIFYILFEISFTQGINGLLDN